MGPEKRRERLFRILPATDDLTLVLLKGHLLLEEELNSFLENYTFHYSALKDARLTFRHKLQIACSLCPIPPDGKIWEMATELNKLRNRIAHHVEVPELEKIIRD